MISAGHKQYVVSAKMRPDESFVIQGHVADSRTLGSYPFCAPIEEPTVSFHRVRHWVDRVAIFSAIDFFKAPRGLYSAQMILFSDKHDALHCPHLSLWYHIQRQIVDHYRLASGHVQERLLSGENLVMTDTKILELYRALPESQMLPVFQREVATLLRQSRKLVIDRSMSGLENLFPDGLPIFSDPEHGTATVAELLWALQESFQYMHAHMSRSPEISAVDYTLEHLNAGYVLFRAIVLYFDDRSTVPSSRIWKGTFLRAEAGV